MYIANGRDSSPEQNAATLKYVLYNGGSIDVYRGYQDPNYNGGWISQSYRTITVKQKITDSDGELFYKLLQANAEKIDYVPEIITFTVDGVAYQAESNMTFFEWCNSKYNTLGAVCKYVSDYIKVGEKCLGVSYAQDIDGYYSVYPNKEYKLLKLSGGGSSD
jgi:hypothetical protein